MKPVLVWVCFWLCLLVVWCVGLVWYVPLLPLGDLSSWAHPQHHRSRATTPSSAGIAPIPLGRDLPLSYRSLWWIDPGTLDEDTRKNIPADAWVIPSDGILPLCVWLMQEGGLSSRATVGGSPFTSTCSLYTLHIHVRNHSDSLQRILPLVQCWQALLDCRAVRATNETRSTQSQEQEGTASKPCLLLNVYTGPGSESVRVEELEWLWDCIQSHRIKMVPWDALSSPPLVSPGYRMFQRRGWYRRGTKSAWLSPSRVLLSVVSHYLGHHPSMFSGDSNIRPSPPSFDSTSTTALPWERWYRTSANRERELRVAYAQDKTFHATSMTGLFHLVVLKSMLPELHVTWSLESLAAISSQDQELYQRMIYFLQHIYRV